MNETGYAPGDASRSILLVNTELARAATLDHADFSKQTTYGSFSLRIAREAAAACGAFEWVALGYLGLSSAMILLLGRNMAHPFRMVTLQSLVALLILALCAMERRAEARAVTRFERWTTGWWHFWRHWYPHLFFLFCFEELGSLVHLANPAWQDAKLIAFDHWLFGVHPSVWLEQFATPARNDFFQFAYLTYFTYLLIVGGALYARREWQAYWSVMTYSAIAYGIGYVIAILFPIESPWFAMAEWWHGGLNGGAFTAAINFIERFGRVRGAAFPSEHVAGAVAAFWGAWRHRRWLAWTMLPLVVCMCVATVWGRYHYAADVFAGIATGTLGYVLGSRLMRRAGAVATAGALLKNAKSEGLRLEVPAPVAKAPSVQALHRQKDPCYRASLAALQSPPTE